MRRIQRVFFWMCWPALSVYFYRSQRSRVVIRQNGKTLLVKGFWKSWFADERWGLPGGGIARDESPADGAARELSEELGVQIKPTDLQPLGKNNVREHGIGYMAHYFLYEAPDMVGFKAKRPEIVELSWLDTTDQTAQQQFKPEVAQALELLANR